MTSGGQACRRPARRALNSSRTRVRKRAYSSAPETGLFNNSCIARENSRQSSDLAVYLGIADIAAAFLRHRTSKEGRSFLLVPTPRRPRSHVARHQLQRSLIVNAALKKADQPCERDCFFAINREVPFLNHFPKDEVYFHEIVRRYHLCARSNRFAHTLIPAGPGLNRPTLATSSMRRRRRESTVKLRGRSRRSLG